jgi:hypothetical protein
VPQELWPVPPNYTWDSYYAPIPQAVIDKAVKKNMAYEAIGSDKATLLHHLKQCPIQIIIPEPTPNHAVLLVHIEGNTAYYFDSYAPYLKTINLSKIYNYALKIVLKGQDMEFFKVKGESTIVAKFNGQYREIATPAELFPYVKKTLGIPDTLNEIGRDLVNSNLGKQIVAGITF